MSNPSMLWESFEALKPRDMGRLTKSPMRIKRWNIFEQIDQTPWTKGKAHLRIKQNGLNLWTRGKAHLKKKGFETRGKALMRRESEYSMGKVKDFDVLR